MHRSGARFLAVPREHRSSFAKAIASRDSRIARLEQLRVRMQVCKIVIMTARLTISLSTDVLKALKTSKHITLAVASDGGPGRGSRGALPRASGGKSESFRSGSLPAKLVDWAKGLKKPFGVPDLMKKFKIKRGHASMLIAYVSKHGAARRVGRGAYSVN